MSGQQIGTVVGFVVGAYFGYPQLGAAIGGYIGGVIDPTQINGPHIGDGQNQSSADGVPIPWVIGTGPCVGNICMTGPRYEVKKTEGGKGSTTETNTFESHQSFTILICESSETRNSTIVGIQMVRQNGKIVYDVRPGSTMLAESAKWKEKVTFYFGAEDQMPDPTMEAIFGVGNTPANRGVCTAVFRDFNRSEFGDAIPQFEWVVVGEGSVPDGSQERFAAGRVAEFQNAHWPLLGAEGDYVYSGRWVGGLGGGAVSPEFNSIAEVQQWVAGLDASTCAAGVNVLGVPTNYVGYAGTSNDFVGSYLDTSQTLDVTGVQPDATDFESVLLLYQWETPDAYTAFAPNAMCSVAAVPVKWYGAANGSVVRKVATRTSLDYQAITSCGSNTLEGIYPLCIQVRRKRIAPAIDGFAVPDLPGWYVDTDGNLFTGYTETTGTFRVLSTATITGVDPSQSYARYELGPALRSDDPDYSNATLWTAAYTAAVAAGDLPAGWTYNVQYPVEVSSAWLENGTSLPAVTTSTLTLAEIVKRINRRGGLTDADINVTELTDQVIGYPISNQYTAADCLRPLAGCYFFKGSEYDGQIHFHKDGADADLVVDPQDFINGEDEDDQDKRGQAKEYPRLLTGSYLDPTLDFAIGKTKAQRRSPDVRAIGEASLQIPVCMGPDEAQQATEKALKIMWSKLQGSRKFSLPYGSGPRNYLRLVPCKPFGLDGRRYVADQITLDDGQMLIECSYDRQSAFRSNATAIPTLPPTPPVSTISGPTMFAALNLPALRTKDNTTGMYLAACGLRTSWRGCLVQISFDGGATFSDTVPITTASVMGLLTEHITDEGSGAEPISVSIYGGELTNAAAAQLANGANGFAMPDANDVSEVAQFATQDETSPKRYDLTDVTRGRLSTDAVEHFAGDRFVMLQNVVFLPIDARYAGQILVFRPVSFGTDPALNATYDALFQPIITGAETIDFLETESGQSITTESGDFLQVE